MTRILYGRGQSRSFRCLWALIEAEVAFEYVEVTPETVPENYALFNSQGKVPALVDDSFCLTESAAIVNYAGGLSPGKGFIPDDIRLRARYDQICYFVMTELEQPLWTVGKHRFAIPEEHRHEVMFATATWEFEKAQTALGQLIADGEFSVGESFSFADLLLAHTINWADRFKMPVEPRWLQFRDVHYKREACLLGLAKVT